MKYVVVVIFKNGMKLDKTYDKLSTAREVAHKISEKLSVYYESVYFAHTYFKGEDVLCVTWQEVKENDKISRL